MKLRCKRKELCDAVQIVENVTVSATTRPVLQDIKFTAEGGVLELSATDLEVGVRYFVKEGVNIFNEGSIIVSGARVSSILREWVEEEVELAVEENVCHLSGQDSHFKLFIGDIGMFPTVPEFIEEEGEGIFLVQSNELAEMIKKTSYAVATERVKQELTGVLLVVEEGKISMLATDGRRLAWIDRNLVESTPTPARGIVPIKGLSQILKVISANGSTPVKIQLKETYLLVKTENAVISCRLIEGQYPKVEEVIPVERDKKLEIETERLLSAAKRASLLTSGEYRVVRFSLEPGKLTLSSEASELGEARIELDVQYAGEPIEIGFNPDFMVDALKAFTKDKVTMELKQPESAVIMIDGQGYLSMVMPVNLLQNNDYD